MHELGIMTGVVESVQEVARANKATSVNVVRMSVGSMTEAMPDSLQFAFEILVEGTILQNASLEINIIQPKSQCLDCNNQFDHDRFSIACPNCKSINTKLIAGKELHVQSIEIDTDTDTDTETNPAQSASASAIAGAGASAVDGAGAGAVDGAGADQTPDDYFNYYQCST